MQLQLPCMAASVMPHQLQHQGGADCKRSCMQQQDESTEPALLFTAPGLFLDALLTELPSSSKSSLMRASTITRATVLQNASTLSFSIDSTQAGQMQTGDERCSVLRKRTEPLDLSLNLKKSSATAATDTLFKLACADGQFPTRSGHSCVKELTVHLPKEPTVESDPESDPFEHPHHPLPWLLLLPLSFKNLTQLEVDWNWVHPPVELPAALAACVQLQAVTLTHIDQAVLSALATLPHLSEVTVSDVLGIVHTPEKTASVWSVVRVQHDHPHLVQLSLLPLHSIQRLVIENDMGVPLLDSDQSGLKEYDFDGDLSFNTADMQRLDAAALKLAAHPGLEWDGSLDFRLRFTMEHSLCSDGPLAAIGCIYAAIGAVAPLAARGGGSNITLCVGTLLACIGKELPQALKAAFGDNLQSLAVWILVDEGEDDPYLTAGFWLELARLYQTKLDITVDMELDEEDEKALAYLEAHHLSYLELDLHHGRGANERRRVMCGTAAGR